MDKLVPFDLLSGANGYIKFPKNIIMFKWMQIAAMTELGFRNGPSNGPLKSMDRLGESSRENTTFYNGSIGSFLNCIVITNDQPPILLFAPDSPKSTSIYHIELVNIV